MVAIGHNFLDAAGRLYLVPPQVRSFAERRSLSRSRGARASPLAFSGCEGVAPRVRKCTAVWLAALPAALVRVAPHLGSWWPVFGLLQLQAFGAYSRLLWRSALPTGGMASPVISRLRSLGQTLALSLSCFLMLPCAGSPAQGHWTNRAAIV